MSKDPPVFTIKNRLCELKQTHFNNLSDLAQELVLAIRECNDSCERRSLEHLYLLTIDGAKREAGELRKLTETPTFPLHLVK